MYVNIQIQIILTQKLSFSSGKEWKEAIGFFFPPYNIFKWTIMALVDDENIETFKVIQKL